MSGFAKAVAEKEAENAQAAAAAEGASSIMQGVTAEEAADAVRSILGVEILQKRKKRKETLGAAAAASDGTAVHQQIQLFET